MKAIFYSVAVLAMALVCSGCYPQHVVSSPGAEGFVRDAKTGDPIAGAKVGISRTWQAYWSDLNPPTLDEVITNVRSPVVITDTNGGFSIPPEHLWVRTSPMPTWHAYGTLIIQDDGYQPDIIPISDVNGADEQSKTYLLTPLPSTEPSPFQKPHPFILPQ